MVVPYAVVDTSMWPVLNSEPMGQPDKIWLAEPEEQGRRRWLFKPVTAQHDPDGDFVKGTDWAEKIVSELASTLGVPAAQVELAEHHGRRGSLSRDITDGRTLTHGNELLPLLDPDYPAGGMHEVERYTLEAAFAVLEGAMGPPGALAAMTAKDVFAGYLVLDAWVANQDRHHANWAVLDSLSDPWEPRRLAPSFDHASSLGFQLSDRFRQRHLIPADLERWAAGGRCRTMYGRPGLLDLAVKAVETAGPSASWWKQGLEALDPDVLHVIVERVPAARLSQLSRMFITGLLDINRRRLLDAL